MNFTCPIIPYLIRATYDWIVDARLVPFIEIDTSCPNIIIPPQFVHEKTIVFNIAPKAVSRLKIDNQVIEFDARFGSQISHLYIPIPAVIAIFSRENGFGMQLIPTIEYLGKKVEFTDSAFVPKAVVTHIGIPTDSKKSSTHSPSKSKLKLITKEKRAEDL